MRAGEGAGIVGVVVLTVGLLACGDEPRPAPTGAPMSDLGAQVQASGRPVENRPPHITQLLLHPQVPKAGEPVRAFVTATDPDGDAVRLAYDWRVNGEAVAQPGAELAATHVKKGFEIELTVTPSDELAAGSSHTARSRVGNQPPTIRWVRTRPAGEIAAGIRLAALVEARDVDGDPLETEYVWLVNGEERARGGSTFMTEGLRRGDTVQVRVTARDGLTKSAPVESPVVSVVNAAPVIRSKPGAIDGAGLFRYVIEAEDPDDHHALRYRLVEGPRGMSVDALTGELTWRADRAQAGRHTVEVAVEDRDGGTTAQRFEISVTPEASLAPASPGF